MNILLMFKNVPYCSILKLFYLNNFISSMRISCMHAMNFDHFLLSLSSIFLHNSTPSFSNSCSLYFLWSRKSNLCYLYTHDCGVLNWSIVNHPGATPLKNALPSPRSHQLSVTLQLGVGTHECLLIVLVVGWMRCGPFIWI